MRNIILGAFALLMLSGCATKAIKSRFNGDNDETRAIYMNQANKADTFRFQPVIGTRQEDTKVMIDMGKFAKIWVKNYRNKNQTFVASHDIITKIKEPGFIAGEEIDFSKRDVVKRTYGGNTFSYRSSDIVSQTSKDDTELQNGQIKDYVNNYKETQKYGKLPAEKIKTLGKYDKALSEFLDDKREEKK